MDRILSQLIPACAKSLSNNPSADVKSTFRLFGLNMRFLDRVLVCKEMTNPQAQQKLKDEMMVRASKRVLQGEWRKQKSNEDVALVLWRNLYCLCSGPTHSSDRPFSGPARFVEDVELELLAKYPLASKEMKQYVDDVAMNGCRDNVWQSLCDVVGLDWKRVCTMSFGKD